MAANKKSKSTISSAEANAAIQEQEDKLEQRAERIIAANKKQQPTNLGQQTLDTAQDEVDDYKKTISNDEANLAIQQ